MTNVFVKFLTNVFRVMSKTISQGEDFYVSNSLTLSSSYRWYRANGCSYNRPPYKVSSRHLSDVSDFFANVIFDSLANVFQTVLQMSFLDSFANVFLPPLREALFISFFTNVFELF